MRVGEPGAQLHLVDGERLDVDSAMLAVRLRGMLRESKVDERTLLALHALAAAGQVQIDWGIGGWQFFLTPKAGRTGGPEM